MLWAFLFLHQVIRHNLLRTGMVACLFGTWLEERAFAFARMNGPSEIAPEATPCVGRCCATYMPLSAPHTHVHAIRVHHTMCVH